MRRSDNLNRALLGTWSWRYAEERGVLWLRVIRKKYGRGGREDGGW